MPEVTHEAIVRLPPEAIWDFVKDMNLWAPLLTGYQSHEIDTEDHSIWTLKGDVGILSREVRLDVNVTEWNGPQRVTFTLDGLNEVVNGDGTFEIGPYVPGPVDTAATPGPSPWKRFVAWIFRVLFRRVHGPGTAATTAPLDGNASVLRFRLRMEAGGPTGPLVNAMLEPALLPATEELANGIAAHLHKTHGIQGDDTDA